MRRGIIAAALTAITGGFAALYWGAIIAPAAIGVIMEEASRDVSIPRSGNSNQPEPVVTSTYRGQTLAYLAGSEVLAKYPGNFVEQHRARLAGLIDGIQKEPAQIDRWVEIGLIKKTFDNYTGTRDVWEHIVLISPGYALNYYNLGNLYGMYLGDLKKAEVYFKKAIEIDSTIPDFYTGLAEFYRDFYKERADLVDDVLLSGMKKIPNDANIILQLAGYYKSIGDKDKAIQYLSRLLEDPSVNNEQRQTLREEIEALRAD